jgi:hypothetical protein
VILGLTVYIKNSKLSYYVHIDEFKRLYPEMFSPTKPIDIILGALIISLLFVVPYLYIRFLEDRVIIPGHQAYPFYRIQVEIEKDHRYFS